VEIKGWVHERQVCLAVDEVVLGFTERDAHELLVTVERELKVLCPSGFACDDCEDTGQLWLPLARGAVSSRDCECQFAARR
jgi:hypothetical protein